MANDTGLVTILKYKEDCGELVKVTCDNPEVKDITFSDGEVKAKMPDLSGCGHPSSPVAYTLTAEYKAGNKTCTKRFQVKQEANTEPCPSGGDCTIHVTVGGYYEKLLSLECLGQIEEGGEISYQFNGTESGGQADIVFTPDNGFIVVRGDGTYDGAPNTISTSCGSVASCLVCKYAKVENVTFTLSDLDNSYAYIDFKIQNDEYNTNFKHLITLDLLIKTGKIGDELSPGLWTSYYSKIELDLENGSKSIRCDITKTPSNASSDDKVMEISLTPTSSDSNIYFVSGEYYYIDLYYYHI